MSSPSFFFKSTGSVSRGSIDQREDFLSSSVDVVQADDAEVAKDSCNEVIVSDPPHRSRYD